MLQQVLSLNIRISKFQNSWYSKIIKLNLQGHNVSCASFYHDKKEAFFCDNFNDISGTSFIIFKIKHIMTWALIMIKLDYSKNWISYVVGNCGRNKDL